MLAEQRGGHLARRRSRGALGWRFGADLGFVGFDETEWAPLVGPGLTTIAQPTDDLGRVAMAACSSACRDASCRRGRSCCPGSSCNALIALYVDLGG